MKLLTLMALVLALVAGASVTRAQQDEWRRGRSVKDGIAVIANDAIITIKDVEDHARPALEVFFKTYFSQPDVLAQKHDETFSKALEDLVERQLMLDDFKAQGGVLPDGIIEDQVKARVREAYGGDRATLTRTLKAQGITFETFRKRVRDEIIVNYMRSKNISQAILISPAKIEQYYATNLSQFKVGEQVKLRMIILNAPPGASEEVLRRMKEILALIEGGASFTEMASVYSEGSTQGQGGDWGWGDRENLLRGLYDVAFGLQPGQYSAILGLARLTRDDYWVYLYDKSGHVTVARHYAGPKEKTEEKKLAGPLVALEVPLPPQEFYIMKVEERRAARTRTLEEMRDEIEKNLITLERARLQQRWTKRLKEKSFVRLMP